MFVGRSNSRSAGLRIPIVLSLLVVGLSVANRVEQALVGFTSQSDVLTLNGRTVIWTRAIESVKHSVLLGVGPYAFDPRYRSSVLGLSDDPSHSNAHNQLVQTLVERGAIGVCILVALCFVLVWAVTKHPAPIRGPMLGVVGVYLTRFVVETPLYISPASINGAMLLLIILLAAGKSVSVPTDPERNSKPTYKTSAAGVKHT
jgi:O-antigen ligase